jgi:hypothetical protein
MPTRRTLLKSAGWSFASLPITYLTKLHAAPVGSPVPAISTSLCNNISASLGALASKVHQGTANKSDILLAANTIETLRQYFKEQQFDLSMKAAATQADPSRYNPNDVSKVVSGYMGKYVPGFDVTGSLPTTVDASLETLRSGGLDATFSSVVSLLQDKASSWPERANYKGGAMLRPVINNPYGACAEMAVWIGLFGAGVFTTTFFGCTVGEEFIILCPALAVISTTLGFVKIITLVLC